VPENIVNVLDGGVKGAFVRDKAVTFFSVTGRCGFDGIEQFLVGGTGGHRSEDCLFESGVVCGAIGVVNGDGSLKVADIGCREALEVVDVLMVNTDVLVVKVIGHGSVGGGWAQCKDQEEAVGWRGRLYT
jgi:hypothetical protein